MSNKLIESSFKNLSHVINHKFPNRSLLYRDIESKGFSLDYISKKIKIRKTVLIGYFKNKKKLTFSKLKKICDIINSNPHFYVDRNFKEDKIGKFYFDFSSMIIIFL